MKEIFRAWLGIDVPGITKIISWMFLVDVLLLLGALMVHQWWAYVVIMPLIYVGGGYANNAISTEAKRITMLVALFFILLAALAFGESLGYVWLVPAFLAIIMVAGLIVGGVVVLLVIAITSLNFIHVYVEMAISKRRHNRHIKADVLS